ncbi:MAG: hypothetical protein WAN23_04385 [Candidatus Acidiferrales bacterium]
MTHAKRASSFWRSEKQVVNDVKSELRVAKKMRLPWWGLLCLMIGVLPIYWLFDRAGRLNMALPLLNCVAVLGFAFVLNWKLRRDAWFWITMTIIVALHVLLILSVPWTTKWVPAAAIAGIDSVDFVVILMILATAGKLAEARKPPEEGVREKA